jgi:hypothetical protein
VKRKSKGYATIERRWSVKQGTMGPTNIMAESHSELRPPLQRGKSIFTGVPEIIADRGIDG